MAFPSKQSVQAIAGKAQQAAALIRKEKKEIVLTEKNREAVEMMVYEGLKRSEAAERVGLTDHALRTALTKPHVLAYLNQCMEVLRTGLRPRALHAMEELLEQKKNESVRFKAAEYLDGLNRGTHTVGATQVNVQVNNTVSVTPGYVIRIDRSKDKDAPQIEHLGAHEVIGLEALSDVPTDD